MGKSGRSPPGARVYPRPGYSIADGWRDPRLEVHNLMPEGRSRLDACSPRALPPGHPSAHRAFGYRAALTGRKSPQEPELSVPDRVVADPVVAQPTLRFGQGTLHPLTVPAVSGVEHPLQQTVAVDAPVTCAALCRHAPALLLEGLSPGPGPVLALSPSCRRECFSARGTRHLPDHQDGERDLHNLVPKEAASATRTENRTLMYL